MDKIKYSHISPNGKIIDFEGTFRISNDLSGKEIYEQVVKEQSKHDIIFQSFMVDGLYLRDVVYIG